MFNNNEEFDEEDEEYEHNNHNLNNNIGQYQDEDEEQYQEEHDGEQEEDHRDLFSDETNQFYKKAITNAVEIEKPLSRDFLQQENFEVPNFSNKRNNNKVDSKNSSNNKFDKNNNDRNGSKNIGNASNDKRNISGRDINNNGNNNLQNRNIRVEQYKRDHREIVTEIITTGQFQRLLKLLFKQDDVGSQLKNKYQLYDLKSKSQIEKIETLYTDIWNNHADFLREVKKKQFDVCIDFYPTCFTQNTKCLKLSSLLNIDPSESESALERINYLSDKIHIFYDSQNVSNLEYLIHHIDYEFDPTVPQFYGFQYPTLQSRINQNSKKFQGYHHFQKPIDITNVEQVKTFMGDLQKRAKIVDVNFDGFSFFLGVKSMSSKQQQQQKQSKNYKIQQMEFDHLQTLYFYTTVAFNILQSGGCMILKLYSCNLVKTNSILYLINKCFQKIQLTKLYTSSQLSNEIYVICYGFKKEESGHIFASILLTNYENLHKNESILPFPLKNLTQDINFEKYVNNFSANIRNNNIKFYEWLQHIIQSEEDREEKIMQYFRQNFDSNILQNLIRYKLPSQGYIVKTLQVEELISDINNDSELQKKEIEDDENNQLSIKKKTHINKIEQENNKEEDEDYDQMAGFSDEDIDIKQQQQKEKEKTDKNNKKKKSSDELMMGGDEAFGGSEGGGGGMEGLFSLIDPKTMPKGALQQMQRKEDKKKLAAERALLAEKQKIMIEKKIQQTQEEKRMQKLQGINNKRNNNNSGSNDFKEEVNNDPNASLHEVKAISTEIVLPKAFQKNAYQIEQEKKRQEIKQRLEQMEKEERNKKKKGKFNPNSLFC